MTRCVIIPEILRESQDNSLSLKHVRLIGTRGGEMRMLREVIWGGEGLMSKNTDMGGGDTSFMYRHDERRHRGEFVGGRGKNLGTREQ